MRTETVNRSETRTVETPVEARQGYRDRPVLVVLVVALVLVAIAFGVVWLKMF
jgi:cobalamin biosynthesis Mg chelatase CobN